MVEKFFEPLQSDFVTQDNEIKSQYEEIRRSCELSGYNLKLLNYLKYRVQNETQIMKRNKETPDTIKAIASIKTELFAPESVRFLFGIYEENTPYIISRYFDKIIIEIKGIQYTWTRNVDNFETDMVEIILPKEIEYPLIVNISMYVDTPVSFFNVPEQLQKITNSQIDTYENIMQSLSEYVSSNGYIGDDTLRCDDTLERVFGIKSMPISQIPYYVRSALVPIQPININFPISNIGRTINIGIELPNISELPPFPNIKISHEVASEMQKFAEQKETAELFYAINRNPLEAIEAEITGHSSYVELSDESNDNGPHVDNSQMNPARRSSVFYWQPWTTEHAQRFLEENKLIHQRYKVQK